VFSAWRLAFPPPPLAGSSIHRLRLGAWPVDRLATTTHHVSSRYFFSDLRSLGTDKKSRTALASLFPVVHSDTTYNTTFYDLLPLVRSDEKGGLVHFSLNTFLLVPLLLFKISSRAEFPFCFAFIHCTGIAYTPGDPGSVVLFCVIIGLASLSAPLGFFPFYPLGFRKVCEGG